VTGDADQLLVNAAAELNRASEAREWRRAVRAMELIGRAAEAIGWNRVLEAPDAEPDRERLRAIACDHGETLGWAVLLLTDALYDDDPNAIVDALYARSGFQVLNDIGTWKKPVVGGYLEEVDEELVDAVTEGRIDPADRPADIPASHYWWFPKQS
jgi:hypothetical protein